MKKIISYLTIMMAALSTIGCAGDSNTSHYMSLPTVKYEENINKTNVDEDSILKIGITQSKDSEEENDIYKGIIETLNNNGYTENEKIKFDYSVASNYEECVYAADRMVSENCDIIITIGEDAVRSVKNRTRDIPVIATDVESYIKSGIIKNENEPEGNITGVSSKITQQVQVEIMKSLFSSVNNVAILYSDDLESKIRANEYKLACSKKGINIVDLRIEKPSDVRKLLLENIENVQAVYCPTDSVVFANMADAAGVCNDKKVPFFTDSQDMVTYGSLASCTMNTYNLGVRTARMALKVLEESVQVKSLEVEYLTADECKLNLNDTTAELLEYKLPEVYQVQR